MFADVTSANVVGYTTTDTKGTFNAMGVPFVSVGNGNCYKLGQILPNGMSEGFDFIQFLEPDHAAVYLSATWYNHEEWGEDGGWCNKDDESELLDNLELTPGTAFLTAFTSGNLINWVASGQVVEKGNDGNVTVAVDGQSFPYVCNPIPCTITLKQIIPSGFNEGFDFIQFLEDKNASVYRSATWYNFEDWGEDGGWCNKDDESELFNDMEINPGQAFLGAIGDGTTNLKFIFPAAM